MPEANFDENQHFIHRQMAKHSKFAMGAIIMKIVILSKENWSHMDNFMGAMLMKMAVFLKENALRSYLFVISYLKIDHWSIFK